MTEAETREALSAEDALRADMYDLLAALLMRPPSSALLAACAGLRGGGDDEIGRAADALARAARATDVAAASVEFHALFIGLGRGEVLPYASYYMTGFLNEKPLASLRADLAALGAERAEGVSEPEDHLGALCDVMAGLIRGRFGAAAPLAKQRDVFNRHLAPWCAPVFADIAKAQSAALYAPVGVLGGAFMEVEKAAFRFQT